MRILNTGLDFYVARLRENKPFAFARYGNGEWGGIFGTATRTGSGSQSLVVPGLVSNLKASISGAPTDGNYFLGIQSESYLTKCLLWDSILAWVANNAASKSWHNGDVFHKGSMHGRLFSLIDQLRGKNVTVVGPRYLKVLDERIFKCKHFIEVRPRNCFDQLKPVMRSVLKLERGGVIAVSAGPMAKVLIFRLYKQIGSTDFLIDFGSLWDPYCSKNTRRYHGRVKGKILRKNLLGV